MLGATITLLKLANPPETAPAQPKTLLDRAIVMIQQKHSLPRALILSKVRSRHVRRAKQDLWALLETQGLSHAAIGRMTTETTASCVSKGIISAHARCGRKHFKTLGEDLEQTTES